jgi:hypothetical protein
MEASRSGMVCPVAVSTPSWRLMMVQKCVLWDFLAMGRYRSLFLFCQALANQSRLHGLDWWYIDLLEVLLSLSVWLLNPIIHAYREGAFYFISQFLCLFILFIEFYIFLKLKISSKLSAAVTESTCPCLKFWNSAHIFCSLIYDLSTESTNQMQ